MKRQPRILAGTAIGLLMASAPLGAFPLSGKPLDARGLAADAPLILVQEECEGENCPEQGNRRQQRRQEQQQQEGQEAPAEEQQQPRQQRRQERQQQQEQEAPAEEQQQPRQQRRQERQQQQEQEAPTQEQPSDQAPAEEAPAEQPQTQEAPAEEQQAPAQEAPAEAPAQEAPAEQAPAEQAPEGQQERAPAEQQPSQEAPAGEQPQAEQPAEGQAPATGEQPAQQGEQPAEPGAQPDGQPAQQGEAPADPNAAPVLDSQKEAPPAEPGAEQPAQSGQQPAQQPAQTGEQPAPEGQQPAQQGEQAAQPQAPVDQGPPPESDAAAQTAPPRDIQPLTAEEGQRIEVGRSREERQRFRQERRERRQDAEVVQQFDDNRTIITINNQTFIDSDDDVRIIRDRDDVYYEELPRGRVREVITRPDGVRVITIRNRYGDVVRRSRIGPDDREIILVYVEDRYYQDEGDWRDPGLDLPPMRLTIPREEYILDAEYVDEPDDYYEFLEQPPVERVERTYSLNEVKRSARIRDKVRRIDMDTLTFEFGSASIAESEIPKLEGVANAMQKLLEKNPAETFLLEGHTDAVGSETANLALSDRRAEAVAEALTNVFDIPPENLATQGYGEQYLKVDTQEREPENRRVAIRRVTSLVAPVASAN